ncbi:hypothetical protein BDW22DRAFT_1340590, partial [Trametopsis cervina]
EEVVLSVQGYILRCSLPPVQRLEQLPKNVLAAKQSVVLTGLGSGVFDTMGRAVMEVHSYLASTLPDGSLQPWVPRKDEDCICLEFSNRYFTPLNNTDHQEGIPFSKTVDPNGVLGRYAMEMKHTEDNEVLYFERTSETSPTKYTYASCDPIGIRPGQLVELQVAFGTVPVSKGRHIMLSKLRSICVISRQVQDVIFNSFKTTPTSPLKRIKRNVGYVTSNEYGNQAARALKRLRLTDAASEDETQMSDG